ncbi:MAG: ATPase involved in DNA repair [uncultured Paraburkholderia sp.]|nr:MAG: ATPase involved in DNA repair [uncultured Paraburkholderia sp.]CAH2945363.1 MAG: ATPase involved in DNA repair [uncultured Paraburkholderia sp.]
MRRVVAVAANACSAQLQAVALPPLPPTFSGAWLGAWVNGDRRAWSALLQIAEIIERADAQAREVQAHRGALAQERDGLDQYRLEIERLRTMRTTAD